MLAILGNHDAGSDPHRITEFLQGKGITVLRNRSIPFEEDGHRLWLAGLDDVLEGQSDLELTLRSIPKTEPVILLARTGIVLQWIFNYQGIPMEGRFGFL